MAILLAAVVMSIRGGTRDTIVLPDDTASAEPESPPVEASEPFLTVARENVQEILATMARPSAYAQSLEVVRYWSGGSARRTVSLWVSGARMRAQIAAGEQTEHLLTDGETLWLWYDGLDTSRVLTPEETVTFDDLAGIPTYETLTTLDPAAILEAGFVTLSEPEDRSCLYISVSDGAYTDRYWVDVNTGLLCRADTLLEGQQVYQLRQTSGQVLSTEDTALQGVFQLPDGTVVAEPTGA